MYKKVFWFFVILVGVFIVWASIYSYNRNRIIDHNTFCSSVVQTCAFKFVPASIWQMITGEARWCFFRSCELGFAALLPCNSVGTTTPCGLAGALKSEIPQEQVPTNKFPTYTINNFTFLYPEDATVNEKLHIEGVLCVGQIKVHFYQGGISEIASVVIATSPSDMCTKFNPTATTLIDYKKGYRRGDFEEMIHSQESITINGIQMLRQVYSQGYWVNNGDGEFFDASSSIDAIDHQLRYVFFDGKAFVIITGWQAELYVDRIAQSVRLIK